MVTNCVSWNGRHRKMPNSFSKDAGFLGARVRVSAPDCSPSSTHYLPNCLRSCSVGTLRVSSWCRKSHTLRPSQLWPSVLAVNSSPWRPCLTDSLIFTLLLIFSALNMLKMLTLPSLRVWNLFLATRKRVWL